MRIPGFLLLLLACGALAQQKAAVRPPLSPSVFLITIDTLRADHVHCYGNNQIQTPALDALAKDGIRFASAFTSSPITNTSHTSILTGLLPSTHGVTDFAMPLDVSHSTLAELLKPKNYHTAAFIGAVILDSNALAPGLDRGFDFYDNFPKNPPKSRWDRVERRGMEVVQHAETWLSAHRTGSRFVWIHMYDPHDPYEPPEPFAQTYKERPYDGEIAYADSVLGNFIAYLQKQGWYDNSLIIVTGDHGEGLGEHKEETHGIFLYDSTTHVPLIVKLPGKTAQGRVVDAQVRTLDILPTVLDVAKVRPPEHLDGESLRPYFTGTEKSERTVFGQTDYPLRFGWAPLRSVRAEGLKFIESPKPELYNLQSDPKELSNVYEPNARVQEFRGMLSQIKDPTVESGAGLPDAKDKIEQQNLLHTAMMASEDNRSADARTALEQVLQMDAKQPTALRQLGELELNAANYAKAAEYLKRAREVRPDDATAAFYQGQALEKTGDLAGAREAVEASLKLTPGQLPARILLGRIYLGLKDAKAAQDQFEAAMLVDPTSTEAQLGAVKALMVEGNFAGAAQQIEPLSKAQPNNPEVFETLAEVYRGLGKNEAAQQAETRANTLRHNAKP
jgi:arylsulfatase A-like enzyme/Flp pilus assembly protein TadD